MQNIGVMRIAVLAGTILGNLDPWAKPISPPCKGGWGDFETVSYGTTNPITQTDAVIQVQKATPMVLCVECYFSHELNFLLDTDAFLLYNCIKSLILNI